MRTAYLAGPMRGLPEFNFPAFHAAAADLRARGWDVFSPAERDEGEGFDPKRDEAAGMAYYMERDLVAVCQRDAVIVLPGWEGSQGARLEAHVARELGKQVLAYPDLTPLRTARNALPQESVLEEAQRLIHGARRAGYGHPLDNHGATAAMFSAYLCRKYDLPPGFELDADDICWGNVFQKASRDAHIPTRENLTDGAGYIGNIEIARLERARRRQILE